MKKLLKSLTLVTVLAMMVASMQMVAFAAVDTSEESGEDVSMDASADEEAPEEEDDDDGETITTTESSSLQNPTTGMSVNPVALMALAGVSLAGAVVIAKKK